MFCWFGRKIYNSIFSRDSTFRVNRRRMVEVRYAVVGTSGLLKTIKQQKKKIWDGPIFKFKNFMRRTDARSLYDIEFCRGILYFFFLFFSFSL